MGGRGDVVACKKQKALLQPGQGTTNLQRSTASVRAALFIVTLNVYPGHPPAGGEIILTTETLGENYFIRNQEDRKKIITTQSIQKKGFYAGQLV
jgi:hypothetical protein